MVNEALIVCALDDIAAPLESTRHGGGVVAALLMEKLPHDVITGDSLKYRRPPMAIPPFFLSAGTKRRGRR